LVLNELLNFLADKKSKLVLYNYDSFLLDFSKKDGKNLLKQIKVIIEQDGYPTSCNYGSNYQDMNKLIF
jgi:hypothetical protein